MSSNERFAGAVDPDMDVIVSARVLILERQNNVLIGVRAVPERDAIG
jgi:hypothetical protein